MQAKRRKTEKEISATWYIVHTAMPFRGDKNEALQSIKEIIVGEKRELEGMFRVILVDDNKLTTYLLYHFTNTAAASQAKREDFLIDCYRNVAVDEILPQPTEEQTFAKPMSFDVVVVTSLNCLDEAS